ncbi:MAG: methionyl-tRNA formyltransferase [Pseudomonadota bacterium]
MTPLHIAFAGTPEFAVPTLRALCESRHRLSTVYTQPDRPSGRGRKLTPSPVKQVALEYGCEVRQPESLKKDAEQRAMGALNIDLLVVVAYGLILPGAILTTPRFGCLNVHASLLPRWRGAAPIHRAVLAGDDETGVTIMQMDEGLDTGDSLTTRRVQIGSDDTSATLHDELATIGAVALLEAIETIQSGTITRTPQNDADACYAEKLSKSEAQIDWRKSAVELDRKVRALVPWPVAETTYNGDRLRVWESAVVDEPCRSEPGAVLSAGKNGVDVATGAGVLRIRRLQLPGGKALSALDFTNAQNPVGGMFGN